MQSPTVELSAVSFNYTGASQKPTVTLSDDDDNVIPTGEYKVTYTGDTVNPGQYTLTITSREKNFRLDVRVELLDTGASVEMPNKINTEAAAAGGNVWVSKEAWVTKYNGPDMNAMNSQIAVESIELAYESLVIAGNKAAAVSSGGAS